MSLTSKINFWFLVFFLGCSLSALATSGPLAAIQLDTLAPNPPQTCAWPAPLNFHISNITTNSITVSWNSMVNFPPGYNIRATEQSSGNVVYNQNIPGSSLTWKVPGLLPGKTYVVRNTPICEDGTMSPQYAETVGTTLILDLIVVSFTPNNVPPTCAMDAVNEYCYADPQAGYIVPFTIETTAGPYYSRYFAVYLKESGCETTSIIRRPQDQGSPFQFSDDNGTALVITDNNSSAARLLVQLDDTGTKSLLVETLTAGRYQIKRFGPQSGQLFQTGTCGGGGQGGKPQSPSDDLPSIQTTHFSGRGHLSVAPNPFGQYMEIALPADAQTDTKITLYGSQGRQVLQQSFPAGTGTARLETESLEPGFYFLQAESADFSESIKVIKTR